MLFTIEPLLGAVSPVYSTGERIHDRTFMALRRRKSKYVTYNLWGASRDEALEKSTRKQKRIRADENKE